MVVGNCFFYIFRRSKLFCKHEFLDVFCKVTLFKISICLTLCGLKQSRKQGVLMCRTIKVFAGMMHDWKFFLPAGHHVHSINIGYMYCNG